VFPPGVHASAVVAASATVPASVHVGPCAVIEAGAVIGERTVIGAGVYVGHETRIGSDCLIYPHVSIRERCCLGNRVIVHGGAVIGADGFGYTSGPQGHTKIPQVGIVQIDDDVEIGALSAVDRARFGRTWIQQGTKIDNLVQLGHNVRVGRNCILVAQVGIAGSSSLGDGVILAGQAGIAGHIHLGDGCRIGAKSGVGQDVPPRQDLSGIPAMPHGTYLRASTIMPKLPEMKRRLSKLEKEVASLREELANK